MALFMDASECPLCGQPMHGVQHALFATTHFISDSEHDLWPYSDAVMHWDCYANWEHQARFARMYFECGRDWKANNPHWGVALADDDVVVSTNPHPYVNVVDVSLAATGSVPRVPLPDWELWLDGEWFDECSHEMERDALATVLPGIRDRFPTAEVLVRSAGFAVGDRRLMVEDGSRISREFACVDLARRVAKRGVACPACGHFSNAHHFDRIETLSMADDAPQSAIVCEECDKRFGPEDM